MTTVPDRGWDRLDAETKEILVAVIAEAERISGYVNAEFGELDIHARPHGDGIAWGVVGDDSFSVARGVWPRAVPADLAADQPQEASGPALDRRELATLLASLRYWQREGLMSAGSEHEIASEGDRLLPLTSLEIDALCMRLNEGRAALSRAAAIEGDPETEAALAEALAVWRDGRQPGPASGLIPLRPDAELDAAAERREANITWADQLDAARDEAEFHRVFTAFQTDPAVDAKAARHIAFALTGDRHATREAALGGIEAYFYRQQQALAPMRGGAAR